ncbi:unnamed protein product [Paramecium sonneborni]|uniref:Uncharacterized protein n=1 Tax=Paramecium sonneborni TaxID=65129 RepID=A0A8S1L240_9CILI|nr:unnamed protein product [Paramecium sonneborni]
MIKDIQNQLIWELLVNGNQKMLKTQVELLGIWLQKLCAVKFTIFYSNQLGQNHGVGVDYYALGVIVYECIMGKRPYTGKSRQEIRDQVIAKQVQIKNTDIPAGWSLEAVDFANKLIQRKPANRLGVNGPDEVKAHQWFKDYSWDKLLERQLTSPYIPKEDEMVQIANENRRDSANEIDPEKGTLSKAFIFIDYLAQFGGYSFNGSNNNNNNAKPQSTNVSVPAILSTKAN